MGFYPEKTELTSDCFIWYLTKVNVFLIYQAEQNPDFETPQHGGYNAQEEV